MNERLQLIQAIGPWRFDTRRVYRRPDGSEKVWESRNFRKALDAEKAPSGVGAKLWRCLWNPGNLNWWIGLVFAVGASLFITGSLLVLVAGLADRWGLSEHEVNTVFFAGSIPFTTAAWLQLFQAANAGDFPVREKGTKGKTALFGWRPRDIGWLSCACQFAGTLLFNINTFDALLPGLGWVEQELAIWVPNFVGSLLFLASGHFAFAETIHANFRWEPGKISWWVTFVNMLGCIAFMISAIFAVVLPTPPSFDAVTISVWGTLIGAIGFLVGALLMLPEAVLAAAPKPD